MKEYRKIVSLPPIRISQENLKLLIEVAADGVELRNGFDHVKVRLKAEDASYSYEVQQDKYPDGIPGELTGIYIDVYGWNQNNEIDRGLSLAINTTFADVQVFSNDEVWFNGKIKQVQTFFAKHGPWYAGWHYWIPFIFIAATWGAFFYGIAMIERGHRDYAIACGLGLALLGWLSWKSIKGQIFPVLKIQSGDGQIFNRDILAFLIAIVGTFATMLGVALQIIQFYNGPF